MRPMIERVAVALWQRLHPEEEQPRAEDLATAHAILEAIREPSHTMLTRAGYHQRSDAEAAAAKAVWVTMIDMALSEMDIAFTSGWQM
jgi:hypothetical protein